MAVIEAQGTHEQVQEWIPRCERMEVLGCYAQTEYRPINRVLKGDWDMAPMSRVSRPQRLTFPRPMNSKSTRQR